MKMLSKLILSLAIGLYPIQSSAKGVNESGMGSRDFVPFDFTKDPQLEAYINTPRLFDYLNFNAKKNIATSPITPNRLIETVDPTREYKQVEFGGLTYYKRNIGNDGLYYTFKNGKLFEAYKKVGNVTTTAYTWVDGIGDPAAGDPTDTSTGKDARVTYGFASCYQDFPLGTKIHVPRYGVHVVDDGCGKARTVYRSQRKISFSAREKILDLRIPNKKGNTWRSNEDIVRMALRHGIQEDREVMVRVKCYQAEE